MSGTAVYTEESINEIDRFFRKKMAYVGSDGRLTNDANIDTVKYVLSNMTGF